MTERTFKYYTCDVFTDTRFGGNQLAVLPDGRGLSKAEMQAIAREFNFAETTFVLPPDDPRHTARVRIFTPGAELPFAGHPTVGTAFVLATIGTIGRDTRDLVFEEGVGPVPVRIDREGAEVRRCTLTAAKLPERVAAVSDRTTLAAALSLEPRDVLEGAQCWSCGNPFLMVPLSGIDAVARCRVDAAVLARLDDTSRNLYPLAHEGADVWRARSFAPHLGIAEDPATGSAVAALAGWLHERAPATEGTARYRVNQGIEMGRPSELLLEFDRSESRISQVRVGGATVMVSEGTIRV